MTQLATIRYDPVIRGRSVVRGDWITRTVLLALLMLFAIVPLLSMFTAALAPQGSNPPGLSWPAHPHWANFAAAWTGANLFALFRSSVLIVLGVVPAAVVMATAAGYGLAQLRVPGGKVIYGLLLAGLTIPYEALITPLYYDIKGLGLLGSRLAVVLPLIGLLMPFGETTVLAHSGASAGGVSILAVVPEHDLVFHELSLVHGFLGFETQRRALGHGGAQQITGGDLRNAMLRHQALRLRSLARSGRPQQNDAHDVVY